MSTIRKLKKSIDNHEKSNPPAILIIPSDTFDPSGTDLITIMDPDIYYKVLEGSLWALENNREGVTRLSNSVAESKPRIIVSEDDIK